MAVVNHHVLASRLPPVHPDPDHDLQSGHREEAQVPGEWTAQIISYVMQSEQVVVDHTLDEVEATPPDEHQTEERDPSR